MRSFVLRRIEDESGISGIGIVAEGTEYSNGKVTLAWTVELQSVAVYDSISDVERIHGHNGKTIIVWLDNKNSCIECLAKLHVDANLNHSPTAPKP